MMILFKRLAALCLATVMAANPLSTWADAGHDHAAPAPAALGAGLPRFSAVSETFELIGVLRGKLLTLYLDRADDNSPVRDATLELELGGVKIAVKPVGEGEFEAMLAQEPLPGVTPVAATVLAGQESDLLAGELEIRADTRTVAAAVSAPWQKYGGWLLAGLLALALLVMGLRRVRSHRINRVGGAA